MLGPCTVRSKLNKFEHVKKGQGPVQGGCRVKTLYRGGEGTRALYRGGKEGYSGDGTLSRGLPELEHCTGTSFPPPEQSDTTENITFP